MTYPLPIADLHCDLLLYLSGDAQRTPYDPEVKCAIPQLIQGKVKLQTMAISSETAPGSRESGHAQAEIFRSLPKKFPDIFEFLPQNISSGALQDSNTIKIVAALENASAFCAEGDDLDQQLEQLTTIQKKIGKLLYISLTWNTENRFGGGALTKVGLKEDGKKLIEYMSRRGIALDLSHTSDHLAYGLLEHIDKEGIRIPILASHSNLRSVSNYARNLPDDLAKEIIRRKGIIGLNFIRYLLGRDAPHAFARHVEHLLNLGGGESLCFGADFFYHGDVSIANRKPLDELFFPNLNHSGTYPVVLEMLKRELSLPDTLLSNLCSHNFLRFISN